MRGYRLARYLWPGFIDLWERGRWSGLATAAGAALALNVLLLITLGWDELVAPTTRTVAWAGLAVVWGLAAVLSGRGGSGSTEVCPASADDLFPTALDEYLRGHWFEAEAICESLIERDPADVEAQLLVASVYRRTGRGSDARQTLERLESFDRARPWRAEIDLERQYLSEAEAPDGGELGEAVRRAA